MELMGHAIVVVWRGVSVFWGLTGKVGRTMSGEWISFLEHVADRQEGIPQGPVLFY
jgi:hypothetical protein